MESIAGVEAEVESKEKSDRRALLKRAGLLTSAAVAGTVGSTALTSPAGAAARGVRSIDVACDNRTFTVGLSISEIPVTEGFPPQGSTFYVEGSIWRRGTIPPGDGFDYDGNLATAIGHWFCYGSFTSRADREEPHVISTQTYLLGRIRPNRLFPKNQITSHGLEGTATSQPAIRAITGGTGAHLGVSGMVRQLTTGTNNTVDPFGFDGPNFRFNFTYA